MKLSADLQQKIYEMGQQEPELSHKEISRRLGVSDHAVARYRYSTTAEDEEAGYDDSFISTEQHLKDAKALERLSLDNARLRSMNRILAGKNSVLPVENAFEEFKRWMVNEAPNSFEFAVKKYPAPKVKTSVFDASHEEIAALVLSDWHGGETITFEETNGLNKYSSLVMANRAWAIIDKFKRIVRGHQAMYRVSKIWLGLLGDFIHGSIHPENILTNDLLDVPSAMLVSRILTMAIEEIKSLGLPIEIDCVVGNHPRIGLVKMPVKKQAETSFDWVIYKMLEQKYEDDPQVTIRIHMGQFGIVNLFDHRVVVEHGYKASGNEDMVTKVRTMFDSPVYRNATGMSGTTVSYIVIGDRHRAKTGEGYMVNGCLSGSNELGVSWRLSPIGAIQQMFGVSNKKIPTWVYPLDTAEIVSEESENSFSAYAQKFMAAHGR